ncbi:hypothetical protein D3C84_495120 [compost metagenome]
MNAATRGLKQDLEAALEQRADDWNCTDQGQHHGDPGPGIAAVLFDLAAVGDEVAHIAELIHQRDHGNDRAGDDLGGAGIVVEVALQGFP